MFFIFKTIRKYKNTLKDFLQACQKSLLRVIPEAKNIAVGVELDIYLLPSSKYVLKSDQSGTDLEL